MQVKLRNHTKQGYYWRKVVCDGCPKACCYKNFRTDVPPFHEVFAELRARHERGDFDRYRFKRRGTILGIMHEWKRRMWECHVEECQLNRQNQVANQQAALPKADPVRTEEEDFIW